MGYVTALALRLMLPEAHITVVGKNRDKLQYFSFVDCCLDVSAVTAVSVFDACFECVGGSASQGAIEQIISAIRPQGSIVLMGVNEESVAIHTRLVLEKGLVLLGASRSGRDDFEKAVSLIETNKSAENYLNVILSHVAVVKELRDINAAFQADRAVAFKTVMEWRI